MTRIFAIPTGALPINPAVSEFICGQIAQAEKDGLDKVRIRLQQLEEICQDDALCAMNNFADIWNYNAVSRIASVETLPGSVAELVIPVQ